MSHAPFLIWTDDVRVSDVQKPFAVLFHPDVGVAAVDGFAVFCHNERFASHHDDYIFVKQEGFGNSLEFGIIDRAVADQLENSFAFVDDFVCRMIGHDFSGKQFVERVNIAFQNRFGVCQIEFSDFLFELFISFQALT